MFKQQRRHIIPVDLGKIFTSPILYLDIERLNHYRYRIKVGTKRQIWNKK